MPRDDLIILAFRNKLNTVYNYLLTKYTPYLKTMHKCSRIACELDDIDSLKYLVEQAYTLNNSALITMSINKCSVKCLDYLLTLSGEKEKIIKFRYDDMLLSSAKNNSVDMLRYTLDNIDNHDDTKALYYAWIYGNAEMVKVLIEEYLDDVLMCIHKCENAMTYNMTIRKNIRLYLATIRTQLLDSVNIYDLQMN